VLTIERAEAEYERLNLIYFGGTLPEAEIEVLSDVRLDGAKRSRCWGTTRKDNGDFHIQLLAGMPVDLRTIKLGHEMIHVEVWPKSHRSKEWKAAEARLARLGFLSEVL
jgi:hypothetical protein